MHPQLAVNKVEAHFFDKHYAKGYQYYLDKNPITYDGQITIEGSPRYFVHPEADQRIHAMNSSIKLILIVTDPSRRIVSDYIHERAMGFKPSCDESFVDLVFGKNNQVQTSYSPVGTSMYSSHLHRWYSLFPKDHILILDGDNFRKNPWEELHKVEAFLHIEPYIDKSSFIFNEEKGFYCRNKSGVPACMKKSKGREHPVIPEKYIKLIREFYAPYNEELEQTNLKLLYQILTENRFSSQFLFHFKHN